MPAAGGAPTTAVRAPDLRLRTAARNSLTIKERARALKRQTVVLYFAFRNPQTPWYAKLLIFLTVAYAVSPIDLIPDFIPVLGYLDDIIIVPLGVFLSLKLIPAKVLEECRAHADERIADVRFQRAGLIIVIVVWTVVIAIVVAIMLSVLAGRSTPSSAS